MLILIVVFSLGWMLFGPGARLGFKAVRLLGSYSVPLKAEPEVEELESNTLASPTSPSDSPSSARDVPASKPREGRGALVPTMQHMENILPGHGLVPRGLPESEDKLEACPDIFQLTTADWSCGEAGLDELAFLDMPSLAPEGTTDDVSADVLGVSWAFESAKTGNNEANAPARRLLASDSPANAEEVDAQLRAAAAGMDLAACWSLYHSLPPRTRPSEAACASLAAAVESQASTPADADYALELAGASGHARLAEAALAAGARLRSAAWLARALARLYAAGLPRRPGHSVVLARAYGKEKRADLAVELWRREEEESSEDTEELYSAALEACVGTGDFEAATRLARGAEWRSPRNLPGQQALLALARWLARRQDVALARLCVSSVRSAGGTPDLATLRGLLTASARCADMAQARVLFEEIVSKGFTPDLRTYSAMIRGYCAIGSLEKALGHFDAMRALGVLPDTSTFDAMLDACASRNMLELTEKVLSDMEAARVPPSNMTLAILVRLYGTRGELEQALEIFEELPKRHGLEVSNHAHGALVAACLSAGRRDLALAAFRRMAEAGCRASARTFESLITSCVSHGDLEEAVQLVDDALALDSGAPADSSSGDEQPQAPPPRRVLLDTAPVEDLLRLIGRRRQAKRLGVPLLNRLQAAGFTVSDRIGEALVRSAELGDGAPPSHLERRRAERQSWCQDFLSRTDVATSDDL